jgi:pentatricopeptide repeat protein
VTLIESGAEKDGRTLLHRVLDGWPENEFEVVGALESLADSYARTDDVEKAERYYRELLQRHPPGGRGSGTSGVVALSLAELLLRLGGVDRAREAAEWLSEPGLQASLFFDVQHFRHAAASARAYEALGRRKDASRWAKRALEVADASARREQFARHPGIGKAAPSRSELKDLRRIAAA